MRSAMRRRSSSATAARLVTTNRPAAVVESTEASAVTIPKPHCSARSTRPSRSTVDRLRRSSRAATNTSASWAQSRSMACRMPGRSRGACVPLTPLSSITCATVQPRASTASCAAWSCAFKPKPGRCLLGGGDADVDHRTSTSPAFVAVFRRVAMTPVYMRMRVHVYEQTEISRTFMSSGVRSSMCCACGERKHARLGRPSLRQRCAAAANAGCQRATCSRRRRGAPGRTTRTGGWVRGPRQRSRELSPAVSRHSSTRPRRRDLVENCHCGPRASPHACRDLTDERIMATTQPPPGWWRASDGRWYPPHLHPDNNLMARQSDSEEISDGHRGCRPPSGRGFSPRVGGRREAL